MTGGIDHWPALPSGAKVLLGSFDINAHISDGQMSCLCFAGTVTNVKEAVAWLGYTYLFVRMKKNPLAYGIPWDELAIEPDLLDRRRTLITNAARELERSKMARYLISLLS